MRIFEIFFFSLVVIPGTFLLHLLDYRAKRHNRLKILFILDGEQMYPKLMHRSECCE